MQETAFAFMKYQLKCLGVNFMMLLPNYLAITVKGNKQKKTNAAKY